MRQIKKTKKSENGRPRTRGKTDLAMILRFTRFIRIKKAIIQMKTNLNFNDLGHHHGLLGILYTSLLMGNTSFSRFSVCLLQVCIPQINMEVKPYFKGLS
jgi:hypothetical protein